MLKWIVLSAAVVLVASSAIANEYPKHYKIEIAICNGLMYPGKWQRAKDPSDLERLLEKVSNDVGGPSKCQKETYEEGKLTNAADEKRLFGDGPFDASANVANDVLQKFNQNVSVVVMPSVN